jgi:hypothetical protein
MVDDLLDNVKLEGRTRDYVDSLLGPPTGPVRSLGGDCDYVYWLGPERSFFSIDSEWLCVRFTEGVASQADIRRD